MHNSHIDVPIGNRYEDIVYRESIATSPAGLPFPLPDANEINNMRDMWEDENWLKEMEILDDWLVQDTKPDMKDILNNKIEPTNISTTVNVWGYKIDDVDAPLGEELSVDNIYNGPLKNFTTSEFSSFETAMGYLMVDGDEVRNSNSSRRKGLIRARIKRGLEILSAFGVWVIYDFFSHSTRTSDSYTYVIVDPSNPESENMFTGLQRAMIATAASIGHNWNIQASAAWSPKYHDMYSTFHSMVRALMSNSQTYGIYRQKHPLYIGMESVKIRGTTPLSI